MWFLIYLVFLWRFDNFSSVSLVAVPGMVNLTHILQNEELDSMNAFSALFMSFEIVALVLEVIFRS